MPAKSIISDQAAQQALLRGISTVSNAVGRTLGPKGRNVALEKKWGAPVITNDGVTIAKEVELPESFENMGAQLIKEAASKTNDVAGDGTTTATVLAHHHRPRGHEERGRRALIPWLSSADSTSAWQPW